MSVSGFCASSSAPRILAESFDARASLIFFIMSSICFVAALQCSRHCFIMLSIDIDVFGAACLVVAVSGGPDRFADCVYAGTASREHHGCPHNDCQIASCHLSLLVHSITCWPAAMPASPRPDSCA